MSDRSDSGLNNAHRKPDPSGESVTVSLPNAGEIGTQLSIVDSKLQDLAMCGLPLQQRTLLNGYYTHKRNKLQLQLGILARNEKVGSCEQTLKLSRAAFDFAQSKAGRQQARSKWHLREAGKALGAGHLDRSSSLAETAEDYEARMVKDAEGRYAQAEASLGEARKGLQAVSFNLELLRAEDTNWAAHKIAARQWEVTLRWEAITPSQLQPAVRAVNETFEGNSWKCAQSTKKLCFAALHPQDRGRTADLADPSPYRAVLAAYLGSEVENMLAAVNGPVSASFKSYFDVYNAALKVVCRATFQTLFEIAAARAELLNIHPVEWAKALTQKRISNEQMSVKTWIKQVCDTQCVSETSDMDTDGDEGIFWGTWRAPRFIHMKPSGTTVFDAERAWTREGLQKSEQLLQALSERFITLLKIDLEKTAGNAHVMFVKQEKSNREVATGLETLGYRTIMSQQALPVGSQATETWHHFHNTFAAMAQEELRLDPRNAGDRWLRAYVSYKDPNFECGQWSLSEGVSEGFQEQFDVQATRAGLALRSNLSGTPRDVWLHRIFLDLLEHESRLLFAATKEGGIIVRICEAAAIHCSRLEKEALNKPIEPAVLPESFGNSVVKSEASEPRPRENLFRETIIRKVQNPQTHTILSIPDAALYFEVRPRTIHRWKDEGKLRSGPRRGSITIESIKKWENKRSRKRPAS